ncbi:MAG TPA: DUF397 domain-containing protein [Actinophytocola sp.]|uniref:DUF397 domain-containing protein n=1 Tax=Actinophytocola sp. TaxID=1872138 RepID=UPI002DDCF0FE|nr:DUF397 domain-containing protein [Actinophytocola sp.]HEV2783717.1 DUF397 domain-containing protein [Actinophytocola sp.]
MRLSIVDVSGLTWRKSSRSGGGSNDACVEVAYIGPAWRKSSRSSGASNANCVEVAHIDPAWRKSSRSSGDSNTACVEVAYTGPAVAVRDSKSPATGALAFPTSGWSAFLTTLV